MTTRLTSESETLYFAYGSNLNARDFCDWCRRHQCPAVELVFHSHAYLPDHELRFTMHSESRRGGVLDVVPRMGQVVPGVLFRVRGQGGWKALERKEGTPKLYKRVRVLVLSDDGFEVEADTFVGNPHRRAEYCKPHSDYVEIVRTGYEEYEHSDGQLVQAAENTVPDYEVDALFCYGTLMRGESRFHLLERFGLRCTLLARTSGRLLDLGAYPGLSGLTAADATIEGDFIRVHRIGDALQLLDAVEGFRGFGRSESLFERTLYWVDAGDGRIRRAWVYRIASGADGAAVIESGCWRTQTGRKLQAYEAIIRAHAGDDELPIARQLAARIPFSLGGDPVEVSGQLIPLKEALLNGMLSERRLAQESHNWVTTW